MDRQVLHRLVNLVVESVWQKLHQTGVIDSAQQSDALKKNDVAESLPAKKLITEKDVLSLIDLGHQNLVITGKSIITPLARDLCHDKNIKIITKPVFENAPSDRHSGYFLLAPRATRTAIEKVVKINQKDNAQGHICPHVASWLRYGPTGLLQQVREKQTQASIEQAEFYKGVSLVLEGAICFIKRYADLADQLAHSGTDDERHDNEQAPCRGDRYARKWL